MKTYKSACSLDCWDVCSIRAEANEDSSVKISGDADDPITRGFLCQKGYASANFYKDPSRITKPMKKNESGWQEITWEQALSEISEKLGKIISTHGPQSLIHYKDAGHGGLAKNIDTAFFNSLGGVTTPTGSLCWGAGMKAQQLDFGQVYSHHPLDMLNSQCILLWGKNPVDTSPHMVPILKEASKKNIPIIVIDPVKSASVSLATHHYPLQPGSDGHLALAMAILLTEKKLIDTLFIENHCLDAENFLQAIRQFSAENLIAKTGLSLEQVSELTDLYGKASSATIFLGYGPQRNRYGCRNIRLIDALGALTGNIGIKGGGVNYANHYMSQSIDKKHLLNPAGESAPTFSQPAFADYVLSTRPREIQGIFVTLSNPLVQLPDTNRSIEAFDSIPFKVVIEQRMTDTAQRADYVLPCTHIMEESDFVMSSMWHNFFTYTEQVVDPVHGVKHEFEIFHCLAEKLNLTSFTDQYPCISAYVNSSIKPLCEKLNCRPEELIGKRSFFPGNEIPWQNQNFETTDGLYHFYIPREKEDLPAVEPNDPHYPLHLISVHSRHSMHSQHFSDRSDSELPEAFLSSSSLNNDDLSEGDILRLISPNGELTCRLVIDESLPKDVVKVIQGWWHKNGSVNQLTSQQLTDSGEQAAYNDCFCRLVR